MKRIFQAFDEKARVLDLVSRYLDSPGTSVVLGSEDDHSVDPAPFGRLDLLRHGRDTDGNAGSHRTGPAGVHARDSRRGTAGPGRLGAARPARGTPEGGPSRMSDRDRDGRPIDEDTLEVRDSGDSLEAALGEVEVTALAAAEDKLRGSRRRSRSSRTGTCASSPSSRTTRSGASGNGRSTSRSRSRASPTTSCRSSTTSNGPWRTRGRRTSRATSARASPSSASSSASSGNATG